MNIKISPVHALLLIFFSIVIGSFIFALLNTPDKKADNVQKLNQEEIVSESESEAMLEQPLPAENTAISQEDMFFPPMSNDGNVFRIVINLEYFNSDEKNIKIQADSNKLVLSGNINYEGNFMTRSRTYNFESPIDLYTSTKEVSGNQLVLEFPVANQIAETSRRRLGHAGDSQNPQGQPGVEQGDSGEELRMALRKFRIARIRGVSYTLTTKSANGATKKMDISERQNSIRIDSGNSYIIINNEGPESIIYDSQTKIAKKVSKESNQNLTAQNPSNVFENMEYSNFKFKSMANYGSYECKLYVSNDDQKLCISNALEMPVYYSVKNITQTFSNIKESNTLSEKFQIPDTAKIEGLPTNPTREVAPDVAEEQAQAQAQEIERQKQRMLERQRRLEERRERLNRANESRAQ